MMSSTKSAITERHINFVVTPKAGIRSDIKFKMFAIAIEIKFISKTSFLWLAIFEFYNLIIA